MSLRYALLGLLADSPQTGYDLTKNFETVLSRYAWSASHSQVYPELRKMTEDGLVEVVDEGARGSRTYAATDEGLARLREWMVEPAAGTPARNGFVLRLFMLSALEPADARVMAKRFIEESEREITALQASVDKDDAEAGDGRPVWGRYAAEFGLRWFTMQRDWAEWVIRRIDDTGQ